MQHSILHGGYTYDIAENWKQKAEKHNRLLELVKQYQPRLIELFSDDRSLIQNGNRVSKKARPEIDEMLEKFKNAGFYGYIHCNDGYVTLDIHGSNLIIQLKTLLSRGETPEQQVERMLVDSEPIDIERVPEYMAESKKLLQEIETLADRLYAIENKMYHIRA